MTSTCYICRLLLSATDLILLLRTMAAECSGQASLLLCPQAGLHDLRLWYFLQARVLRGPSRLKGCFETYFDGRLAV